MLIRITDDKVETFPIAGTRKITDDEEKNKALSEELIHDEKELAEHTMLVDLGRNDIGKSLQIWNSSSRITNGDKAIQSCPTYS